MLSNCQLTESTSRWREGRLYRTINVKTRDVEHEYTYKVNYVCMIMLKRLLYTSFILNEKFAMA